MKTFTWASALTEQPQHNQKVLVQYKTFEHEKIKYTNEKRDWFIKNVQCWLKPISPEQFAANFMEQVKEQIQKKVAEVLSKG